MPAPRPHATRGVRIAVLLMGLVPLAACRAEVPEPTVDPAAAAISAVTTPQLGEAQSGFPAATTPALVGPAAGGPVASGKNRFRVAFRSAMDPIPINKLHEWTVHVETADGRPVEGASIKVSGSMPAHRHGMPTEPKMTADLGAGDYRVEGMKFQMRGDWEIYIDVASADGQSDMATLPLVLP